MTKRALAIMIVVCAVLAFCAFFIAGSSLADDANVIDNVHWVGSPLPPCFVAANMCAGHLLGTDEVARDLLARLIVGGKVTLTSSLWVMTLELLVALLVGLVARYAGVAGRFAVKRFADAVASIPTWPMLVLFAGFQWHGEMYHHSVILVPLLAAVLVAPRMLRAATLKLTPEHLANQALRDLQLIIMLLSMVDFLGYGMQPPTPSWGNMLVHFQANFQMAWWTAVFPAACIFVSVLLIEVARLSLFGSFKDYRVLDSPVGASNGRSRV